MGQHAYSKNTTTNKETTKENYKNNNFISKFTDHKSPLFKSY